MGKKIKAEMDKQRKLLFKEQQKMVLIMIGQVTFLTLLQNLPVMGLISLTQPHMRLYLIKQLTLRLTIR